METNQTTDSKIAQTPRINWYPGHMAKALRKVSEKIKMVDLIFEVRDARAPLATGNESLAKLIVNKKRLVILNKSKLATPHSIAVWTEWFQDQKIPFLFTDAYEKGSSKQILVRASQLMKEKKDRFIAKGYRPPPMRVLVLGIPNTGKSTIINRLVGRHVAATGDRPGITQTQQWIVLGKEFELLDTPGIMPPKIEKDEEGYWLCALYSIKDSIIGKERVASFLVDYLNQTDEKLLRIKYNLGEEPFQDSLDILSRIGLNNHLLKTKGDVDLKKVSDRILTDFRKGGIGRCCFQFPPQLIKE